MNNYIPGFLLKMIKSLGIKDITSDFTYFLISQAEKDVLAEQKNIAAFQKKYRVSTLKEMAKTQIASKEHSFGTDEDFHSWDAAETIIKNRYKEIDQLRRFLVEYGKKHPLTVKRER